MSLRAEFKLHRIDLKWPYVSHRRLFYAHLFLVAASLRVVEVCSLPCMPYMQRDRRSYSRSGGRLRILQFSNPIAAWQLVIFRAGIFNRKVDYVFSNETGSVTLFFPIILRILKVSEQQYPLERVKRQISRLSTSSVFHVCFGRPAGWSSSFWRTTGLKFSEGHSDLDKGFKR